MRTSETYSFNYPAKAGTVLQPPLPLAVMPPPIRTSTKRSANTEVTPANLDPPASVLGTSFDYYSSFTFEDRNGLKWIYRGQHAPNNSPPALQMKFYYATRAGFAYPNPTTGVNEAPAVGTITPSLQWQVSSDSGANFSDVVGATASPLSFTATLAQSGYQYRAVVTGGSLSVTSSVATLTVNPLPVGGADAFTTPTNTPVTLSAAKLKANDTGSGLTIIAVSSPSAQGGTVSLSGPNGTVSYTPLSATFGGTDTFTYTLRNDSGCTVPVTVSATFGFGTAASANVLFVGTDGGNFVVRFAGIPGYTYTVEVNSVPSGPGWTKLGTENFQAPGVADPHPFGVGVFQVVDPLGGASRYYRTVWPSY